MILDELGIKYSTDKSSLHHDYLKVYEQYFEQLRNREFSFIEIGIGGYEYPERGGESLRMWNEYFSKASIIGIDIFPKSIAIGNRVDLICAENAVDVIKNCSPLIIIDDGSHINAETIENFKDNFPYLQSGGFYCAEDLHCSYWNQHFYGNEVPGTEGTAMKFFTDLTHQLNEHVLRDEYKNEYAGQISFIHFYKEMVVIKKR